MTEQRVLDLEPVFGLTARVTAEPAGGHRHVEIDCVAQPGSRTMAHYHPEQEEHFHVLEGTLELLRDGSWEALPAGTSFSVPPGAVHAFRNASTTPVRFRNRHDPAGGFAAHLDTLDRLIRDGKVRGTRDLRSLMYMSMSAVQHRPDVPVKPPLVVVKVMAFIGRLLGLRLEAGPS